MEALPRITAVRQRDVYKPLLSASALYYGPRGYLPQINKYGKCDDSLPLVPPSVAVPPNPVNGFASYPELDRRDWKLGTEKCRLTD